MAADGINGKTIYNSAFSVFDLATNPLWVTAQKGTRVASEKQALLRLKVLGIYLQSVSGRLRYLNVFAMETKIERGWWSGPL